MKKVIITGGPTSEPIDDVMRITGMSTGGMAVQLGQIFADAGYEVVLVLSKSVRAVQNSSIRIVRVETAEDMMEALEKEAKADNTDVVIHAATVGDYKPEFAFNLEDMADELFEKIGTIKSAEDILEILKNPECGTDDSSRLSSYRENLAVKFALTPKIIGRLRFWFPKSILIGCKLRDGVEKGELFDSASALCNRHDMDYVLASDIKDIRSGRRERYLINRDGFTEIVLGDYDSIFKFVDEKLG
jgi:phosphopantothenate--cysteine ligase